MLKKKKISTQIGNPHFRHCKRNERGTQVGICTVSEDRYAGNKPRERWGSLDTLQALLIDTITAHILTLFTGPNPPKKQHSLLYLSQQHTRVGRPGFVYEDLIDGGSRKARRRVCHFAVRGGQAPFCYLYYLLFLSSLADGVAAAVTYVPSAWSEWETSVSGITTAQLERQKLRKKDTVASQPWF